MEQNNNEIIVWIKGFEHGYIFTKQSDEVVGRTIRCVQNGTAFSLSFNEDKFMMFADGTVSHFQVTKRESNA